MKKALILFLILSAFVPLCETNASDAWQSIRLIDEFYAEGAAVDDINGDDHVDIIYGPFWLAGPDFDKPRRYADGEAFEGHKGYSDHFFTFTTDANRDGNSDILVYGFPGKEARLYLNPGSEKLDGKTRWAMHIVANEISNESPTFVDIIPGGLPEMVCTHDTQYGYYEAGKDATRPWTWHAISPKGEAGGRFEHGLGVGDVNNDGRLDILQRQFWYEHPEEAAEGGWKKHLWSLDPLPGGAQILVHDFEKDGRNSIVSSIRAHGFGLAWFDQFKKGKFVRHDIMGESSTDNPHGVCFSQLHALAKADIDGDGYMDFVTGKRYFAHQGKDPGGLQEPVLYWWRFTNTEAGVEFVPHLIHRDSGVGTEITVADLNADGKPDIISGNKKGLTIHIQNNDRQPVAVQRWQTPGGRPQDGYGSALSPEDAAGKTEVPEGFSVDLIAAEPDVTQPITMCFDARGRIWVVEGHSYPERRPEGEGKDRIVILEDSDKDGSFETRKIFAEGINLASGIEVGFGGVYVGAAPNLLFFPDKDSDDKADGKPEILLDGWGYQDTHETLNAFTWGPDGWLYGCHGVFTHSRVGKPGTPDDQRTPINAGVWRFHPVSRQFEVFAHGTSNPWGVEFNEYGDVFVSACVIPHFFHLSDGGRYRRQAGQHFNPNTFDDIKTIADHAHYAGEIRDHAFWGANKQARPAAPSDTSALGGGHAHCGLAIYLADEFPAAYRGEMFFHNLHGHRIVRERLEHDGSGYAARHRPDFVLTNNHDFVGVGVMLGPDGAIYYSDWVDPQTCHHRDVEIWDRQNGRIFRVRYGDPKSTHLDLPDRSDLALVDALADRNAFIARQAQRLLQERAAKKNLDLQATDLALAVLEESHAQNTPVRLRAFWTRHSTGLLSGERMIAALGDSDEHLRGWAVQLATANQGTLPRMDELARDDFSLVVRRQLASKLQRLPLEQRWEIAAGLIRHQRSGHDRNIPLLTWYGIEPLVEADPKRALSLVNATAWPQLKEFIIRRAATLPEGRTAISFSLSAAKNPEEFLRLANQLLPALANLPEVAMPDAWDKAKAQAKSFRKNPAVFDVLARLGARFGDAEFFPHWRAIASDKARKPVERIKALQLLSVGKDPELAAIAREALAFPLLRPAALTALRQHPGPETAEALITSLDQFGLNQRNDAINLLASRPDMAIPLLKAVDSKKLSASLVSPVLLDQFERYENETIDQLIAKNWVRGNAGIDLAQLGAAIEGWKKKLNPQVLARANASRGRQAFATTCGTCHQLFGEGIALGPDLTGSNRSDLAYILENVLAPSAVVGKDYLLHIYTMKDGSVVSGMKREQTAEIVKLSLPGGAAVDVKLADVEKHEEVPQSLMPAGLFDALPLNQVADLVKYLASATQVPLPGEPGSAPSPAAKSSSTVPPPAEGVIRIEGESLAERFQPEGGEAKPQRMNNFGTGWSGDSHLWWIGGKPGQVLTLKLDQEQPKIAAGTYDLTIFPTTAKDYAQVKIAINGQLREVDFYSEQVLPGEAIRFENVNISPSEPLQIDIHITGKNPAALPRYMVGIDRIEAARAGEPDSKKKNASHKEVAPPPLEEGYRSLFDGKTLAGWRGSPLHWRVDKGAITAGIADGSGLKRNQFLVYEDAEFGDFTLRFQFQIQGGPTANSGVQIRSSRLPGGGIAGYQADMDQGALWLGRIYDEHGRKLLVERGSRVTIAEDGKRSIETFAEPESFQQLLRSGGEWNDYEVDAQGSNLEIRINGTLVSALDDRQSGEADAAGKIALQLHSGPGPVSLRFRHVRIAGGEDGPDSADTGSDAPPNIVVIFCDDLGYGDLGCYGSATIRTPHLDRMAREGIRFTDFYAAASVCTPSRAALLTGRYPIRNGMCSDKRRVLFPEDAGGLPDAEITIPEALREAGYATMHVGKWHLGVNEGSRPTDQGFDHSFGIPYSNDMDPREGITHRQHAGTQNPPRDGWNVPLLRDDQVVERPADQTTLTKRYTEESLKFIRTQRASGKPFFLYLAHTMPHVPLFASADFHGRSRAGRYGDTVEEIDWSTGRILDAIRDAGIAGNTLVFFTSDNGPWLVMNDEGGSAGPLRDGKGSTWDGGMRVPGIAWMQGKIEPRTASIVTSTLDLFPTALAMADVPLPDGLVLDGRDLAPFLFENSLPPKQPLFFYRGRELFACRLGQWKAHLFTRPASGQDTAQAHDPPLLFHLGRDPAEKRPRPLGPVTRPVHEQIRAALETHRRGLKVPTAQF